MLYTGNVNRVIFWGVIPLIFLSYLAFRLYEWRYIADQNRYLIATQHARNFKADHEFNCLILGGSNSVFSLSAEQMSRQTDLRCYNLSLLNEGFSDQAYFGFVGNIPIDRNKINYVFYSSVYPLTTKYFAERLEHNQRGTGLSGEVSFNLVGTPIAENLKNWLLNDRRFFASTKQYPSPNSYGDFNFQEYDHCNSKSIRGAWNVVSDHEALTAWTHSQISRITGLFPRAEVHLILPSTFRSNVSDLDLSNVSEVLHAITSERSIHYIEQSPFLDTSVLCDGPHHANSTGRDMRTHELLSAFQRFR